MGVQKEGEFGRFEVWEVGLEFRGVFYVFEDLFEV